MKQPFVSNDRLLSVKDTSSNCAALLLLDIRSIATKEMAKAQALLPLSFIASDVSSLSEDFCDSSTCSWATSALGSTTRSRSLSCTSTESMHMTDSPRGVDSQTIFMDMDTPRSTRSPIKLKLSTPTGKLSEHDRKTKFVGTSVNNVPIKAVLRKKFSWKRYAPELEAYLIQQRSIYLGYSSQLNYTAEQKSFNNDLTRGVLELAADEGYVFEGFTFSAIRDRIRCYYKSYVQVTKNQKRKKR
jgi:hypothetical protein